MPPSADSTGTLKPINAAVKLQESKFGRELFDVVGSGANVKRVKQLLATPDIAVNFEGEVRHLLSVMLDKRYNAHTDTLFTFWLE